MEFFVKSQMKLLLLAGRRPIYVIFLNKWHVSQETFDNPFCLFFPLLKKSGFQVSWVHANVQKIAVNVPSTQAVGTMPVGVIKVLLETDLFVQVSDFFYFFYA